MPTIEVKVDSKDLLARLGKCIASGKDMRPAWDDIGEYMLGSIRRNFEAGGRPEKWEALAPTTITGQYLQGNRSRKRKRKTSGKAFDKYAGGKKVLIDHGELINSITRRVESNSVELGSNLAYAAIHQFGGTAGRKHAARIPARPFLMVQDEDWPVITNILEQHLAGALL